MLIKNSNSIIETTNSVGAGVFESLRELLLDLDINNQRELNQCSEKCKTMFIECAYNSLWLHECVNHAYKELCEYYNDNINEIERVVNISTAIPLKQK